MIAGQSGHVDLDTVPWVIYTSPEIAWVGKTEQELKAKGVEYRAGQFPFIVNGRARAIGETAGFVKMLADAKTDRILGVHMIGPYASELISEAVVAMEFGASSEDIARIVHAHPTWRGHARAALAVDKAHDQPLMGRRRGRTSPAPLPTTPDSGAGPRFLARSLSVERARAFRAPARRPY